MPVSEPKATQIAWDFGTAYEFFISLHVLHDPEYHGVRASWAAGVRSRIPAVERKLLEDIIPFVGPPLGWIHQLPEPKDTLSALFTLRQIAPAERFQQLFAAEEHFEDDSYFVLLQRIAQKTSWDQADIQAMRKIGKKDKTKYSDEKIGRFLDWWVRPQELGEGYLSALQAYQQVFFEQEERRVAPVLKAGLERAQQLAASLGDASQLLTELSQGVRFSENIFEKELILAPAYWTTPLVMYRAISQKKMLILFGARPATMSDIPGELVPDDLLRKLKALADPTRLKILRYLSHEELMPSELARRLHLRAPTVTHHLNELRLAGLVNLRLQGQEKRYMARQEALQSTFHLLGSFLSAPSDENES